MLSFSQRCPKARRKRTFRENGSSVREEGEAPLDGSASVAWCSLSVYMKGLLWT